MKFLLRAFALFFLAQSWCFAQDSLNIYHVGALILSEANHIPISDFVRSGDLLYYPAAFGVTVLNVNDPENPVETYHIPIGTGNQLLHLVEDTLLIFGFRHLFVFDVSDLANPVEITTMPYPFNDDGASVALRGNQAYLLGMIEDEEFPSILYMDITNPLAPDTMTAQLDTSIYLGSIYAFEECLYTYRHANPVELFIIDIGDHENPTVSNFPIPEGTRFNRSLKVKGNKAFIIYQEWNNSNTGTHVYSVSEPLNPQLLTSWSHNSENHLYQWASLERLNHYIFLHEHEDGEYGLSIVNIYYPQSPVVTGWYQPLEHRYQSTLYYVDGYIYLGMRGGTIDIFDVTESLSVDDTDIPEDLPTEWRIMSVFPNPFNPSTSIVLALPESSDLTLSVHNIYGQQVAELVSGRYQSGYQQFTFDGSELSSGIYFIHASVPGKMDEVRKVVLMK